MNPTQFTITSSLIKRSVGGLLALVVLVLAVNYVFTHSLLVVDAQGKGTSEMTLTVVGAKHTKPVVTKLRSNATKNLWLPTDEYTVTLDQDHRSTLALSQVHTFTKHQVTLALGDEAASTRLAGQSTGCGTTINGIYYSYECFQASQIFRHTPNGKEPVSDYRYDVVTPVGSGFIAGLNAEEKDLAFVNVDPATGQQTDVAVPAGLPGTIQEVQVVPNQVTGATYQFAIVVVATNTWYLYHNAADQAPVKVSPGDAGDTMSLAASQFTGDQIVSFFGPKPAEGGAEGEGPSAANSKNAGSAGQLKVYSVTSKQETSSAATPAGLPADSVSLVSANTAVAQLSDGGLTVYKLGKKSLEAVGTIDKVKNFTISSSHAIFTRDSGVYELHADAQGVVTANRLYSGDGFTYSSLSAAGNTVTMQFFTGQASQQASGLPSAYALDLTKPANYPRPEWSLAAAPSGDQPGQPASVTYTGLDNLITRGMSTYQTDDLRYALAQYYKSAGKTLVLAAIDTGTIVKAPHDRNSADTREHVSFNVMLNDDPFKAQVDYFSVSGLRVRLTNAAGAQVYDSGDIDLTK
jgi:hypothetical protein